MMELFGNGGSRPKIIRLPSQATGPLRSGAAVGVGMLRGAGDSLEDTKVTKFAFHVF